MFVNILQTEFLYKWQKDLHINARQELHMSICIAERINF